MAEIAMADGTRYNGGTNTRSGVDLINDSRRNEVKDGPLTVQEAAVLGGRGHSRKNTVPLTPGDKMFVKPPVIGKPPLVYYKNERVYVPNYLLADVMRIGIYTDKLSKLLVEWGLMEKMNILPGACLYSINDAYMGDGLGYLVYGKRDEGITPKNLPQFWWSPAGAVLVESLYYKMSEFERTLTAEQILEKHVDSIKANAIARGYRFIPDKCSVPRFDRRAFNAVVGRIIKRWRLENE